MEGRLDHPPLSLPKVTFTYHDAVPEEQADAFDRLAFFVVLPIGTKDVIRTLMVADYVNAGAIDRGFIDISESLEVIAHPDQKILRCVVLLRRSGRDFPESLFISLKTTKSAESNKLQELLHRPRRFMELLSDRYPMTPARPEQVFSCYTAVS